MIMLNNLFFWFQKQREIYRYIENNYDNLCPKSRQMVIQMQRVVEISTKCPSLFEQFSFNKRQKSDLTQLHTFKMTY